MFDVDGTLVKSFQFDEACYVAAVKEVLGHQIDENWENYKYVTDSGLLLEHLQRHNIEENYLEIHNSVKESFMSNIKEHLLSHEIEEIPGASNFIEYLLTNSSNSISIATGGWLETAKLKLYSAGIDVSSIPIASSNDHYSRTEIMKRALRKANQVSSNPVIYFGDAIWDKAACSELGYEFVLVGNKIQNELSINDFMDIGYVESLLTPQ